MEEKNEKNKYLLENKLDDQFAMFDVILCEKLPAEEDLKLYDIVVYQQDDMYVIHRIIGIEEPNEEHPNERHFLLRGDAVEYSDKFPVRYSQMQGIYRGSHFPFVGSFIMFLQSPAGAVCMLLILFAIIIAPIAEGILEKARRERLGFTSEAEENAALAATALFNENQKKARRRGMDIYYNRPGSAYSVPFQRQDQEIPYRHSPYIDYYSRYQEKRRP
jgi:signal peptidase I